MATKDNFGIQTHATQGIAMHDVKNECNSNNIDTNIYGLVEDVFLVNEFNPNLSDIIGAASSVYSIDDEIKETLCTTEKKPFESFEKQITISVPQPPPLRAEAFTIGGGLFHG